VGKMLAFGSIWESKLKKSWTNQTLSVSAIARSLGVDPLTVKRHATRLNLTLVTKRSVTPLSAKAKLLGRDTIAEMEVKRDSCRHAWLGGWAATTCSTMKSVRRRLPTVYAWLVQNDYTWLERNRPKIDIKRKVNLSVDWQRRDTEYAVSVQLAATRVRNRLDRPIRITRTAIARDLGVISLFQKHRKQLPNTMRTLQSVIETPEKFLVRRVCWAASSSLREGINRRRTPARATCVNVEEQMA
jgi:hypothetical protein